MYIELGALIVIGMIAAWLVTRADRRHHKWWLRFSDANVSSFAERYMLTVANIERDPTDASRSIYHLEGEDRDWGMSVEIAYCSATEPTWRNYVHVMDGGFHAKVEEFINMDHAYQQALLMIEQQRDRDRTTPLIPRNHVPAR